MNNLHFNTLTQKLILFLFCTMCAFSVKAQKYTWIGGSSGVFGTAANWSPQRISIANTDSLFFTSSATVTGVTTQTIARLTLSGTNTAVYLKAGSVAAKLTISNTGVSVPVLTIASTDTLHLGTSTAAVDSISINFAGSGNIANIAGYLILDSSYNATYNNCFYTTNSTTTVTGTIINGGAISSTSPTLVFNSGSNYTHNRVDGVSQTLPIANFANANVTIQGISYSGGGSLSFNNIPATMAGFTFNAPLFTSGGVRLNLISGSSLTINGNYSISLGGSIGNVFAFGSSAVTSVSVTGKMYVTNCLVAIGRGNMNWTVTDSLVLNSGELDVLYGSLYTSGPSVTSSLTVGNFKQAGNSIFKINSIASATPGASTANFTVTGNFTKTSSGTITTSTVTSTLSGSTGPQVGNLIFGGTTPQTFISNSTFLVSPNVQIANTGGAGNNTVTLNSVLKDSTLTLTSGVLVTSATNYVIGDKITGGSSSTYIVGTARYVSASTSAFTLPLGYNSKYVPITITPNAATLDTFTVQYPASAFGVANSPLTSYDNSLGYSITTTASISGAVSFSYSYSSGIVNSTADLVMGYYTSSWSEVSASPTITGSVTSGTISDATFIPFTSTNTYVSVGSINSATNLLTLATYTWAGSSTGDYQVAANWTPNRISPSTSDVIKFTSSASVINVPTQTIGQLILSGTNTSVSLKAQTGSTSTLSIGNGNPSGTDLSVPSSDTLRLATGGATTDIMSLAFATSGNTASIAGYLILDSTYNGTYANNFNTTNCTMTVTGTITNGGTITSTATTLVFSAGSNYTHNRVDGVSQTLPVANFANANVTIQGITYSGGSTLSFNNIPATMAGFTFNTPLLTSGSVRLNLISGSSLTVNGNYSISLGGSGGSVFAFGSSAVTSVSVTGKMYVTNCLVAIGRGNMNWTVTDSLVLNSGELDVLYGSLYTSGPSVTSSLTVGNFKQAGNSIFKINSIASATPGASTANFTVTGNFTKTSSGTITTSTVTSTLSGSTGPQVGNLIFGGTTPQTFISNSTFLVSPNVQIANTGGAGNNTVTLNSVLKDSTLTLTSGVLVTSATNYVIGDKITGGSSSTYIVGTARYVSASTSAFTLPLGYNSKYVPITITPNAATLDTFTVQYPASAFGVANSPLTSYDNSLGYSITTTASISGAVSFSYSYSSGIVNSTADLVMGYYTSSWSEVSASPTITGSVTSGTISDATFIPFTSTNTYVSVGSINSATNLLTLATYTWAGSSTGDYQVAANWTPNRISPSTSDVIKFTSSASVINVPTQTIGQLILSGTNTSVSLKAQTGSTSTLSIGNGNPSGTDLSVPSSDTLRLATGGATTDIMSLAFATSGNTASIAGYLILDSTYNGTYANNFNTANCTVTITGTIINGGVITSTATTLVFSAGSNYIHNRVDAVSNALPIANLTNANVTIQGLTKITSTMVYSNFPISMASFTLNTPLVTSGAMRFSLITGGTTVNVTGNFILNTNISNSISGSVGFNTTALSSVNVGGKMTVTNTSLFMSRGAMAWTVVDSLLFNGGEIDVLNNLYTSTTTAITASLTVGDFKQTSGTLHLNGITNTATAQCTASFNIRGNFTKTGGTDSTFSTISTSSVPGAQIANLIFNGSGAQTYTSNSLFNNDSVNLVINNSAGVTFNSAASFMDLALTSGTMSDGGNTLMFAGNISATSGTHTGTGKISLTGVSKTIGAISFHNLEIAGTISLTATPTINGGLTLTSGNLALGNNNLTYSGTITGGSTSSYIVINGTGRFIRNCPSGVETLFPIGTTTSYAPLKITTATTSIITTSISGILTNAPGDPTQVANLQWSVLGSVNPGSTAIKYYFNSTDLPSNFVIAAPCEVGTYVSSYTVASAGTPISVGGSAYYVSATVASIPTSGTNYYVVGNTGNIVVSATAWLGTISTDWLNATNWSNGVPSSAIDVTISSTAKMPLITTAQSVKNLTITSGTITNNGTLSVKNNLSDNGTIIGTGTTILNGGAAQTISGTGTVAGLTINNSNGVSVSGTLGITGVLTLQTGTLTTNGNVTLKSTSIANSGILAPYQTSPNTGTLTGNVTVERYIPHGFRGYRDMAPAVYNAGTIFKNWQENGGTPSGYGLFITGNTAYAGAGNAGTTDANGFDKSGTVSSNTQDYTYVNGTWTALANTNATNLDPFAGYRLLVRGDRTSNLYTTQIINTQAGLTMYNATALRATGQLITGTVTYTTSNVTNGVTGTDNAVALNSAANGFSMVANPYVCPVSWTTVYNNSVSAGANINGTWYFLDPTYSATGSYDAYNAITGSANTYLNTKASDLIQACQAFFIQNAATSPVAKVVFTESAKQATSTKAAIFGSSASSLSKIYISLNKQTTGATTYNNVDGAAVAFRSDFGNTTYGPQDAIKFGGTGDNISIAEKGKSLSIDGRLPATSSDAIAIKISSPTATNYQLSIDASNYTNNGFEPLLYDAFKNTTKALGMNTTTIDFTVDATNAATYSNRFTILFAPSALPVNSIVASASLNNKIATINWNTVGEKNVAYYAVEKSTDAKTFSQLSEATAKNTATASYSATDNVTATTYYRIEAVSATGNISYSNVVKLTTNNSALTTIALYPNPLKGKTLKINMDNVAAGKYTVSIYNALGEKVAVQSINHEGGSASHAISINNALAAGVYSVTIREEASGQLVHEGSLSVQK